MKQYSNIDAQSVKLHGKFLDKLTTEGGFYSGQLGEVAYKTDIPLTPSFFYGLTVKTTGIQAFPNINVISFDATDFYLSQPTVSPTEVKVELRRDALGATKAGSADIEYRNTVNSINTTPANFKMYWRSTIPPNGLTKGQVAKVTILGTAKHQASAGTPQAHLYMYLDGKKVIDSLMQSTASNANILARQDTLFLMQTSPTTFQLTIRTHAGPRTTSTEFGDLATDATGMSSISHTGELISSQSVERKLYFYILYPGNFTGFQDHYFSKIEYLA